MATDDGQPQNIATAVVDISERITVLVREEIELAKAEIGEKLTQLVKGAVVGLAAGIFIVTGLLFLLHGAAWGIWAGLFGTDNNDIFLGFLIVAVILFVLAGLGGWLAYRAVRSGAPPTPELAIEEARLIRETMSTPAIEEGER